MSSHTAESDMAVPRRINARGVSKAWIELNVIRLLFALLMLVAWEALSRIFEWDLYVSTPTAIIGRLVDFVGDPDFYTNLRVTAVETLVGFLIGVSAGLAVGMITGGFRTIGRVVEPFLNFLNSVPRVALAPLFLLIFGFGLISKVAVVVSVVFFVMAMYADAGVRNVDEDLVLNARILGANKRQVVSTVLGPSILVWLFPAIRLSIAYSFLSVVIAEFVGATAGLGFYILKAANSLDTAGVMAAIAVLALLSVGSIGAVGLIERRVLHWKPRSTTLG